MSLETNIHFVCTAPEHAQTGRDREGGVLTIEQGKWALCPWGKTELHLWAPVKPLDLQTARRTRFAVGAQAARHVRGEPADDSAATNASQIPARA